MNSLPGHTQGAGEGFLTPKPTAGLLRTRQPTADRTGPRARRRLFARAGRGLLPRGQAASLGRSDPVLPREGGPSRCKAPPF